MFSDLSSTENIFWVCAILGSLFFLFKILVTLAGGGDLDVESDVNADALDSIDAHGTEVAFKLISLTSISSFIMMFGWVGLASYSQFGLTTLPSLLVAFVAGLITMYLVGKLFLVAGNFTSKGASFSKTDLIGQVASVYHEIPENGRGKIQITIAGMHREFEAESDNNQKIESFKSVKIIKLLNESTVIVKEILEEK